MPVTNKLIDDLSFVVSNTPASRDHQGNIVTALVSLRRAGAMPGSPVLSMTAVVGRSDAEWLKVGQRVRVTLEPLD